MDIFHVLNRGVDKRDIVLDDGDRIRFIHNLYALNDKNRAPNPITQKGRRENLENNRSPLVNIHAFCLMSNHYHMLISAVDEDIENISKFMQKFNMAYTKFFNEKYQRNGVLWQGVFKIIPIKQDAHYNYIPYYIHLNPLDFAEPKWRSGQVSDTKKALAFLRNYRWSSHLDYLKVPNFPSVICKDRLELLFKNDNAYEREISHIIQDERLASESTFIE